MSRRKNPFTCYFCHKKIENETEIGHTSVCGNVLISCPQKCGAYVPRMDMPFHQRECPNRVGRSTPRLDSPTKTHGGFASSMDGLNTNLDNHTGLDPKTMSLNRKPDIQTKEMFKRIQKDIEYLSGKLNSYGATSRFDKTNTSIQQEIDRIKHQSQLFVEWQRAVEYKLDTLTQTTIALEKTKADTDTRWVGLQQKLLTLDRLELDIKTTRETFLKEQNYNRHANLEFAKNFDEFREFFEAESATSLDVWNGQKKMIDDLYQDVATVKLLIDEQKAKNASVVFDIKTISQIASEAAEKLEMQERDFGVFKEKFEQMKLDFEILENLATADASAGSAGHIVWRITDFEAKMAKSKANNTFIKSPIFYTHDFGYKIRIVVFLNGLKKWKDRYTLISIHVLKGEYDALLKWPCSIEGSLTLRDVDNIDNPRNFLKRIIAKRQTGDEENEEPQESSLSYIFIPHTTLIKEQYMKNDEIYLELRIDTNKRLHTETTL